MRTNCGAGSHYPDDFLFSFGAGPVLYCTWARHGISGGAISSHRTRVHRARRNALDPKFSRFAAAGCGPVEPLENGIALRSNAGM
jgi:hypothetical protein